MTKITPTKRTTIIEYAIRDLVVYAKKLENAGKKILYLNIGDPLKFDFDTPQHIKKALIEAIQHGINWYSPSEGLPELRQAISEKEKNINGVNISPENVVVTTGVSEAIQMVMGALLNPNDEILVPGPTYPPYSSYAKFFDGRPIPYRTIEEEGWQPDIDDIEKKINNKTRAIVLINPNNPCGALYKEKTVKQIINLAGQHDLPVISDEIYDRITYDKGFISASRLARDVPVIGLNGFSKVYLMTGWRLGYVYFHHPNGELNEIKDCIQKEARVRLCTNTPVQKAAVAALNGPQDHVRKIIEKLKERRDYAWKRLNKMDGISCTKPEGAFYLFPKVHEIGVRWKNDKEFVLELLKKTNVLFVHGSGFDPIYGAGHFRSVFLPPIEILEKAFDMVENFIKG
jgi:tyrosine/nicotianamine family aminotransferase